MPVTTQAARSTRPTSTGPGRTSRPSGSRPSSSGTAGGRTPSGRRSRARIEVTHPPLGSLTQRELRVDAACAGCGSIHVTRLTMNLTDGTPVDFTSCHHCEHRTWQHAGAVLTRDGVLERTRKP
jgi:hypothetical protein